MSQPYPDEGRDWPAFAAKVEALYPQAGQRVDTAAFWWYTRTAYDIGAGLSRQESEAKHLNELRVALKLVLAPSEPVPPAEGPLPPSTHGPLTEANAKMVLQNVASWMPTALAVYDRTELAIDYATQLLIRYLNALRDLGFEAFRQRNPSGQISGDKINIKVDGEWRLFDVFSLGFGYDAGVVDERGLPKAKATMLVW